VARPAEAEPTASPSSLGARERAARFCRRFGLRMPILQAPMAGACPVGLSRGQHAVAYFMAHAPRGFFLYFWVAGGGEWSLDRLRAPASASALSPSRA
jgi:hypothetical protein